MSHSPKGFLIGNVTNESKATMFTSPAFTGTPTGITATHVGLGNVTNESKATMFTSPAFTGTPTGITATHVGLGNVTNESKATMFTSPAFTGTPTGITATHVGLGNVTNESKTTMFSSPTFTGTVSGVTKTHVGLSSVENTALSTWAGSSNITTVGSLGNTQISSLGIGTAASGTAGEIRATNNITGYYTSDRSLKENIRNITGALDKVRALNGVMFDWKQSYIEERGGEDGYFVRKADTGVIAQEVEAVLPEVVGTRENGTKAVAYEKLAGLLIESIKELDLKVEEIKRHLGI